MFIINRKYVLAFLLRNCVVIKESVGIGKKVLFLTNQLLEVGVSTIPRYN